VIKFLDS